MDRRSQFVCYNNRSWRDCHPILENQTSKIIPKRKDKIDVVLWIYGYDFQNFINEYALIGSYIIKVKQQIKIYEKDNCGRYGIV